MTYIDLTDPKLDLNCMAGQVTQEDIDHGVKCNHEQCALARAVERMFPGHTIFVDDYIAINDMKGETVLDMAITDQLLEWIDAFDNKKPVEPIPLIIYKSQYGMNDWILCIGEESDAQCGIETAA